jgi:hypothetical protein
MSLRPGKMPGRGIAVFPFLKTTDPIQLGSFKFRSTNDTVDLPEDDAVHVREIADMLFLKDGWNSQPSRCPPAPNSTAYSRTCLVSKGKLIRQS